MFSPMEPSKPLPMSARNVSSIEPRQAMMPLEKFAFKSPHGKERFDKLGFGWASDKKKAK